MAGLVAVPQPGALRALQLDSLTMVLKPSLGWDLCPLLIAGLVGSHCPGNQRGTKGGPKGEGELKAAEIRGRPLRNAYGAII